MKRFLLFCAIILVIYACKKTPADVVYDTHLFQQLQAHNWVFDSAKIIDSLNIDTTEYASDTALQITEFSSGLYNIKTIRDSAILDSTVYQAIYNTPDKIYYYISGGQVLPNQYLTIDTVNEQLLRLNRLDSLSVYPSVLFYHAE